VPFLIETVILERGCMRAISFWLIARSSQFGVAVIQNFFMLANNRQRFLGRGKNYSKRWS
jgi:hypothetical protein